MSTSFVEYRGRGFWSWDGYLEHVLALLADRIGSSPQQGWQAELRDYWRTQSSGSFRGWINPKLDEFVTSEERCEALLALLGGIISQPGLTPEAQQTARFMDALLRGQLNTDASSPLDYMVSGSQPYEWSLD
jgi:hypothetical protein